MVYKIFVIIIGLLVFLRPHFNFVHPILSTYLADFILMALMLFCLLLCKFRIRRDDLPLFLVGGLLILLLLIPTTINFFRNGSSIDVLIDYGKIAYFMFSFWILYFLYSNIPNKIDITNKIVDSTYNIIFIISMIQLLNPIFLGSPIKILYGSSKLRNLWSGYPRIYGSFFNANWFGVYLVFYLTWLNTNMLQRLISYKRYIVRISMLIILFVFSGSRTAIIGAAIALLIQMMGYRNIKPLLAGLTVSTCIMFGMSASAAISKFAGKTINRYIQTFDTLKTEGLNIAALNPGRMLGWITTFDKFKEKPIFGFGNIGNFIPHNSYLYFLNAFGLFGLVSVILTVVLGFISITEKYKGICVNSGCVYMKRWRISFIPSFLIMSLTAEFMFTTQVMFLLIIMFAIELSQKNGT